MDFKDNYLSNTTGQ